MKNLVFFITHKTLNLEHAKLCFYSLAKQNGINDKFDVLYIYNSHENELSNELLLQIYDLFDLNRFFKQVRLFNYDQNTHKSLGADVSTIKNYVKQNYDENDRVLLLKSDCVLSKNYFSDIFSLPKNRPIYFVAPFICAKERVCDDEIIQYSNRETYIQSDDITFFVEDQINSSSNDFTNRPGIAVTDEQIKFTSCYVITDFSCHFISINLLDNIIIEFQSWGGAKFYHLTNYFIGTNRSFVIHKYHDIISENRSSDREGPVVSWLKS